MHPRTRNTWQILMVLVLVFGMAPPLFTHAAPANAPLAADPTSVAIAGSLQSELGCAGDWDPSCSDTFLTYDAADDVWQGVWTVPAGSWEYKAALNGGWDENYGQGGVPNGANIPLVLGAETSVKFYYDHKTHWVTDNQNSVIATAVGNFQAALGCTGDWQPDCLRSWLQDPDGDGIYKFETTALTAGSYEGKVAINESWDENYGQGGVPGGANIVFNVPADGARVTFAYDAATHILLISAGHGLDNNVEYVGLGHNSQGSLYRAPFGAMPLGDELLLRFRTFHGDVERVRARFYDTRASQEFFREMTLAAEGVSCYDDALTEESCDFWETSVTPADLTTLYYRFIITDGTSTAYYADDNFKDGGWGEASATMVDNSYAVTVYDPAFQPLPWMQNAVIYQIFPDRFNNGDPTNDPTGSEPRYRFPPEPDDQIIVKDWDDDLPEGYCRGYVNPAEPCTEGPMGRDYFGGDLVGVHQKLDYLQSLGVTVLYFNPIFEAGSNHAYDTQDYYAIDTFFGDNGEFTALVEEAHARNMRVVLDGVFNHVSSDSPYFDRYGHFTDVGACESLDSPYRDWFIFHEVAPGSGTCVGAGGALSATYDAWYGFDSLPVLDKTNPEVVDLIYASEQAVARYWLDQGIDGWRLDVMPDPSFPGGFWQEFRQAVQDTKPDAVILGELWKKGDVLPFVHGDQADSTMNYRFRNAVQGFLGRIDNKGFYDDGQSDQPPSMYARKLMSVREDYPDATYYSLMNLLDSHDTERILWSLTPGEENREDKEFNAANVAHGKEMLRLAVVLQMTTPGAPTIYYGDEVGVTGHDDPDDRRTYPWTTGGDQDLLAFYQEMTALRRSNPVFSEGEQTFLHIDDDARTLAYLVRSPDAAALVAVNHSDSLQTLTFITNGQLPAGVLLYDVLGALAPVTSVNGEITFELPAQSAAVLLPAGDHDLIAPAAPANLAAVGGNGSVTLTWDAVGEPAQYLVFRSPLSHGGFEMIGLTSATSLVDSAVTNGRRYFYHVRAVDAALNLGEPSNEAQAVPAFPIGWAGVQWPPSIVHVLSVNPTENIYGQVWVQGLTDSGGDPDSIIAELGFGSDGSDPSTWTWKPMTHNAGCSCGDNYEYVANLRPEQTGEFDYLVRFSTDLGQTWTYGYVDSSGTRGALTVNPNPDITPPAAPTNLRVTDWSAGSISLAWDAVTDAAEYWLYRDNVRLAILTAPVTTYVDETVVQGVTYTYVVHAVDMALNLSGPSNEVSQTAEPKMVNVTFRVRVPAETPPDDVVHITGSVLPLEWNPSKTPMTEVEPGIWEITLPFLDGTALQYKYTRGVSWDRVEWWGSITSVANRAVTIDYGTDGTQLVDNTAIDWGTGPDDTKAVQFWRDPLVASHTVPPDGVSATFSRIIQPPASGTYDDSIVVTLDGEPVAGTVASADDLTLTWTPAAELAPGEYTVTVFNVRSSMGGDSVPMQTPYIFTFTVDEPPQTGYLYYLPMAANEIFEP